MAGKRAAPRRQRRSDDCSVDPRPAHAIEISVNCVDNSGSTFSATFGYVSAATGVVTIPAVGELLSPAAGQSPPSEFLPGEHVFTITAYRMGRSSYGR